MGYKSIARGTEETTRYPSNHLYLHGWSKCQAEKLVLSANGDPLEEGRQLYHYRRHLPELLIVDFVMCWFRSFIYLFIYVLASILVFSPLAYPVSDSSASLLIHSPMHTKASCRLRQSGCVHSSQMARTQRDTQSDFRKSLYRRIMKTGLQTDGNGSITTPESEAFFLVS